MTVRLALTGLFACMAFVSYSIQAPMQQQADTTVKETGIDSVRIVFVAKVSTIFKKSCSTSSCHRGTYPKLGLNLEPEVMLEATVDVPSSQVDTLKLIDTEQPEKSYLLMKVRGDEGIAGDIMPKYLPPLTKEEIDTIEKWIDTLRQKDPDNKKSEQKKEE